METAKLFWSGRSQAVRLPKDFRFRGREVRIRRHGSTVILEPLADDWTCLDAIAGKLDFMEAFPDEGDMDMPQALAAYRDVGYPYMLMPDHVPQIDGRDPAGVAFAYCYGYIQALLDALAPPP